MCTKGQPYKFRQIYKFREQRLSVAFNDHQTQLQIGSKIPYHKNRIKYIHVHPKIAKYLREVKQEVLTWIIKVNINLVVVERNKHSKSLRELKY